MIYKYKLYILKNIKMRKLTYSWSLFNNKKNFFLQLLLNNPNSKQNYDMNIYTNKLIMAEYLNYDINKVSNPNDCYPEHLELVKDVYFPENIFFATYRYQTMMNLSKENTLLISGSGEFDKIEFELINTKNNYLYKFNIDKNQYLLK